MESYYNLSSLKEGQKGKVKELLVQGAMRRRLQDLGIIEGTDIECLHRNSTGDLIAYYIRGAAIALRKEDSSQIVLFC